MTYSITFWFNDKSLETKYKDVSDCSRGIKGLESIIVRDLKNGLSLEDQKLKWTEMLEDIDEDWSDIELGSNGMKNFVAGIVILKKLQVEIECGYGYLETETFKQVFAEGFVDSKDFRKMYKEATGESYRRPCHVCQTKTKTRCSCCEKVYYCSVECQRADWKNHRESIKLEK